MMTKLENGAWVVVADGEKALFLHNETDGDDPHLTVFREEEQDNPPNREQKTHKAGRMPDTGQGQRSALDDTDWHELEKERFAEDLADILYKQAHKGKIKSLVIVASPNVLGVLRDAYHKTVADKVVHEIPKTLTNHPIEDIEDIIMSDLAAA